MPELPNNSNLLAEAGLESLQELLSRDPEQYRRQDRDRIVAELRAMRTRFQLTEAQGKKPSAKRASTKTLTTNTTLDDLDL